MTEIVDVFTSTFHFLTTIPDIGITIIVIVVSLALFAISAIPWRTVDCDE